MVSQSVTYLGTLRCSTTHGPSGIQIITDAPTDNHGRGESFSPTDLVVSALATCIVTTMGIRAQADGVNLDGTTVAAEKHMSSDPPRRIARIVIRIGFPANIPESYRPLLERIAHTCPVRVSIHPDIAVECTFQYGGT